VDGSTWLLDPDLHHLNHGSFGAVPVPVLQAQDVWRRRIERDPVGFVDGDLLAALDRARQVWASVLGADPDGVVMLRNTTSGVGAVLAGVLPTLRPGDEVLVTDHAYNATRVAVEVEAARRGLRVVTAPIPFPLDSPDQVTQAVVQHVGERTGLVVLDLVTSPTALRLPVEQVVAALGEAVPVLVDAAHGPGMVEMAAERTGAAFVVANGHKWLCAPRGSAAMVVREDWRERVRPLVVSHGWEDGFAPGRSRLHATFDWTGTDDPTPWLCVPDAVAAIGAMHPDGMAGVRQANRALALQARDLLVEVLGIEAPAPDEMLAAMAAVPLPGRSETMLDPLGAALRSHGFVVAAFGGARRVLRVSAFRYNTLDEYAELADLLPGLLAASG
jgi:isopenicillin-N epimerase